MRMNQFSPGACNILRMTLPSTILFFASLARETLKNACAALDEYADHIESERGNDFRSVHFLSEDRLKGRVYSGYGVPIALRSIAETFRK